MKNEQGEDLYNEETDNKIATSVKIGLFIVALIIIGMIFLTH